MTSQQRNRNDRLEKKRRQTKGLLLCILTLIILVAAAGLGIQMLVSPDARPDTASIDDSGADSSNRIGKIPEALPFAATEETTAPETQTLPSMDADWNLYLVNRWNPIQKNYEPELVEVPGGEMVDARIYEPLMTMLEAAREGNDGQLPIIVSGYRTTQKQQELYDGKIAEYTQQGYSYEEAVKQSQQWVAVPGYSEHQLGLAVDINGAIYDIYTWLQENSYKYGFIFRYPGDKTELTGVAEEVWHYRYVGVEVATQIYEQGICLEEYLP